MEQTFEELIEKLAEWPEGCTPDQFREYQRNILTPYLADREERIRTLEAQIASEHELPRPGEAGSLEDGKKGT